MLRLLASLIILITFKFEFLFVSREILVEGFNPDKVNPIKMVNPGDRIHIPCSVMHPGGSVQWIRNGKPILLDFSPSQRRHWNISNDGQASLTINRVTKTDEGVWECWELDSMGNVKQKAHVMKLEVTNVPEEPYLQLQGKRLEKSAKITVRENNGITIECVVRGASPPVRTVNWYISGRNLTQSSQLLMEYSPQEDNYETKSVLLVNVTKQEHSKLVICQAEHISWQHPAAVSASFNVLCKLSRSFVMSHQTRLLGGELRAVGASAASAWTPGMNQAWSLNSWLTAGRMGESERSAAVVLSQADA